MTDKKRLVSIICPAYNEQDNVCMFYDRVKAMATPLGDRYEFEIIFTNNRSVDRTRELILELRAHDPSVKLLTLSRNFGYQASVLCGLTHATGDASVVIDIDCEDPPELIADFIARWEEGYDVVYGIRNQRIESRAVLEMRKLFYWLLQKSADNDIVLYMAEFALLTKDVRRHIIDNRSTFPFLRTEIGYVGFNRIGVPYVRQSRAHGKTHYNFFGMSLFAIGGMLSSSTVLLRASAYIGAALLALNFILLALSLSGVSPQAFLLLVGLDLMYMVFFLAILSVYTARIYKNGVSRPVFIVDWSQSAF